MVRFLLAVLLVLWAPSPLAASSGTPPTGDDLPVMGASQIAPWARARFLSRMNPQVDLGTALNLSLLYEEEAGREGVSPDLAFAQMLLETSFLRFGGQVRAIQNNFSGLGALDGGDRGLVFASPRLGIRAQVQHLKYYATLEPLVGPAVNPRLVYVKRATAPTASKLSQAWASDPDYGRKLVALVARMRTDADQRPEDPPRSAPSTVARSALSGN